MSNIKLFQSKQIRSEWIEVEQKWYGWSHRAIFGFGISSKVKVGDCGFEPGNKKEFIESIKSWYNDEMYSNLKITEKENGIEIVYDIIPKNINENYFVYTNKFTTEMKYTALINENSQYSTKTFKKFPNNYGKGEWSAKTLDDAKEMAIDFANSVS